MNTLLPPHFQHQEAGSSMVKWLTFPPAPSLQTPTSTQAAHKVKELKFCTYAYCEFCGTKCSLKNWYSVNENVSTDTRLENTAVFLTDILIKFTKDICAIQFSSE